MNFTKTIINAIKCWVNKQIKDVNEKITDLNTNVTEEIADLSANINDNFVTKDAMNTKMDAKNPVGTGSFSMNRDPYSVVGEFSHAEGYHTIASGDYSHAEGLVSIASGMFSHAEGGYAKATGNWSHAEGDGTEASGAWSHAEGSSTIASGYNSHAEGENTIAAGTNQHVQGKHNIEDTEHKYAHIVGNGTFNSTRSNAHTLDWDGNAWFSGNVYVGGTSQSDATILSTVQTPDWNQNDESAADYIKNRPFYEGLIETDLFDAISEYESKWSQMTDIDGQSIEGIMIASFEGINIGLELDKEYVININGTRYTSVAKFNQDFPVPLYTLGDGETILMAMNGVAEIPDDFIYGILSIEGGTVVACKCDSIPTEFKILTQEQEIYKIDPKYISDDIARKSDLENLSLGTVIQMVTWEDDD